MLTSSLRDGSQAIEDTAKTVGPNRRWVPLSGLASAGAFGIGNAPLGRRGSHAQDAESGALYFDADGVGGAAAVHFATLSAGVALGAGDFTVI